MRIVIFLNLYVILVFFVFNGFVVYEVNYFGSGNVVVLMFFDVFKSLI